MGNYDYFSHYAVIWWAQGQASVIKIGGLYVAGGMLFNTNGTDQQGRQWQLDSNNGYCF